MVMCDLSCTYRKICPGRRNCTLEVEKRRKLGIILMQREQKETLRLQPANHRPLRKESRSLRLNQPPARRRVQVPRLQGQAWGWGIGGLHSVQGEVAHALLELKTLIKRPWPGSMLRDLGQVTGCDAPSPSQETLSLSLGRGCMTGI